MLHRGCARLRLTIGPHHHELARLQNGGGWESPSLELRIIIGQKIPCEAHRMVPRIVDLNPGIPVSLVVLQSSDIVRQDLVEPQVIIFRESADDIVGFSWSGIDRSEK